MLHLFLPIYPAQRQVHHSISYKASSQIDNARADILDRKAELQDREKPLDAILRLDEDRKIKYNYPQLAGTHKALKSS